MILLLSPVWAVSMLFLPAPNHQVCLHKMSIEYSLAESDWDAGRCCDERARDDCAVIVSGTSDLSWPFETKWALFRACCCCQSFWIGGGIYWSKLNSLSKVATTYSWREWCVVRILRGTNEALMKPIEFRQFSTVARLQVVVGLSRRRPHDRIQRA